MVRLPIEKMKLSRDELLLQLRSRNIGASIHYPPLHTILIQSIIVWLEKQ